MKKKNIIKIHALWDSEAQVWVAESHDVPGLATEADTMEILIKKLQTMIPELLEANGLLNQYSLPDIPFSLLSERTETVRYQVANG